MGLQAARSSCEKNRKVKICLVMTPHCYDLPSILAQWCMSSVKQEQEQKCWHASMGDARDRCPPARFAESARLRVVIRICPKQMLRCSEVNTFLELQGLIRVT